MTTGSRRLTVQRWLARLQTRYQSSTGVAAPGLWFELASDFQTSLLKFKINMELPPSKWEREDGGEGRCKAGEKVGATIVCIHTDPEIWVSLETIILSVSSQCCPKGWQAGPVGSLQFAERLPPARGLCIGSLKHCGPLLLVIKKKKLLCKYIFLLSTPTRCRKRNFFLFWTSQRHRGCVRVGQQVVSFALR